MISRNLSENLISKNRPKPLLNVATSTYELAKIVARLISDFYGTARTNINEKIERILSSLTEKIMHVQLSLASPRSESFTPGNFNYLKSI